MQFIVLRTCTDGNVEYSVGKWHLTEVSVRLSLKGSEISLSDKRGLVTVIYAGVVGGRGLCRRSLTITIGN